MIRGGILVTGTEVLTGIISDRNGPWISERMRDAGIQAAQITVVGDRPGDILTALESMREEGLDVIVTSGGLGPTADDLTAEVVGRFQGREMLLDVDLERRIGEILERLSARWPNLDMEAVKAANRKQAVIPEGSAVLEPVGTAPGLVVSPVDAQTPIVVVLPGPPRELQPMWPRALAAEPMRKILGEAEKYERGIIRMFGIPESELAAKLQRLEDEGLDLSGLEVTTCLRRGEIEVATTYAADAAGQYHDFSRRIESVFGELIHSLNGETTDEIVARLAAGRTVAVAESCTGGLLAGRLTERAGASDWFLGGVTAYSDTAKTELVGVDPALIAAHGAVSDEVALSLAEGAKARFEADFGVGVTGIAGPSGGSAEKPVGTTCFAVSGPDGEIVRNAVIPGGRADVRDRATTVALHLLRRALLGACDA